MRPSTTGHCLGAVALAALGGCDKKADDAWVRFNADDTVEVAVTASAELGPSVAAELTSTTGAIVVGSASVDPGSGPVGTDHDVIVQVNDAYEDVVDRVTVSTDAGERGVVEHELVQDSADHGYWWKQLQSQGESGEERTDTFTFQLWTATDVDVEPVDTDGDTE